MSQIKATEIEGDVSVGRHITAGGNAVVRGDAVVKMNLTVEGHLEARNIKGCDKGVFSTTTKLEQAYPNPEDGWWALVGTTLPAILYIVEKGKWVSTGKTAGNPDIDIQQYNEAIEEINGELSDLTLAVSANRTNIEQIRTLVNSVGTTATSALAKANANATQISEINTALGHVSTQINDLVESTGTAGGIASLGADGKVPGAQLPEIPEQRVLPFGSVIEGEAPMVTAGTITNLVSGTVHFVAATKCFVFLSGFGPSAKYYGNWPGADAYGPANYTSGRTPSVGKLYVSATKGVYLWDGTEFADVNAPLAEALDTRLGGMSLRVISAEEDERMTEEETHDPDTIYLIPEEDD